MWWRRWGRRFRAARGRSSRIRLTGSHDYTSITHHRSQEVLAPVIFIRILPCVSDTRYRHSVPFPLFRFPSPPPQPRPPQCLEILLSICDETSRGVDGLPRPGSVGIVEPQPTPNETNSCCMTPHRIEEHSRLRPRRDESNTVVVVAHSHHPRRCIWAVRWIEPHPTMP